MIQIKLTKPSQQQQNLKEQQKNQNILCSAVINNNDEKSKLLNTHNTTPTTTLLQIHNKNSNNIYTRVAKSKNRNKVSHSVEVVHRKRNENKQTKQRHTHHNKQNHHQNNFLSSSTVVQSLSSQCCNNFNNFNNFNNNFNNNKNNNKLSQLALLAPSSTLGFNKKRKTTSINTMYKLVEKVTQQQQYQRSQQIINNNHHHKQHNHRFNKIESQQKTKNLLLMKNQQSLSKNISTNKTIMSKNISQNFVDQSNHNYNNNLIHNVQFNDNKLLFVKNIKQSRWFSHQQQQPQQQQNDSINNNCCTKQQIQTNKMIRSGIIQTTSTTTDNKKVKNNNYLLLQQQNPLFTKKQVQIRKSNLNLKKTQTLNIFLKQKDNQNDDLLSVGLGGDDKAIVKVTQQQQYIQQQNLLQQQHNQHNQQQQQQQQHVYYSQKLGQLQTFNFKYLIKNGGFAQVFKIKVKQTSKYVALKKMFPNSKYQQRQALICKILNSPYIIKIHDVYCTNQPVNHKLLYLGSGERNKNIKKVKSICYGNGSDDEYEKQLLQLSFQTAIVKDQEKNSHNNHHGNYSSNNKIAQSNVAKDQENTNRNTHANSNSKGPLAQTHTVTNIVMDLYESDLHDYIKMNTSLDSVTLKMFIFQMLRGVLYLHSNQICHRDIKPKNLLINQHRLVLADFGSAKIMKRHKQTSVAYICSRYYRAPELILGHKHYDKSIDIWSIGCVIGQMLLGKPIFEGTSTIDQLVKIVKILGTPSWRKLSFIVQNIPQIPFYEGRGIKNIFPRHITGKQSYSKLLNLLEKMLVFNPINRVSVGQALAHPYFDLLRDEANMNELSKQFKDIRHFVHYTRDQLKQNQYLKTKLIPTWANKFYKPETFLKIQRQKSKCKNNTIVID